MANEPLKGVAPQVQVPRPAVPQVPQAPAATQVPQVPQAPEVPVVPQAEPMKERTQENFEKLLDSNNRLFQQNQANNVLIQQLLAQQQRIAAQQAPQQPVTIPQPGKMDVASFITKDPQTGEEYIDRQKMQDTLTSISQRAIKAEETSQQFMQAAQQQEKIRQEREAFNTYPELNPQAQNYDRLFNRHTRAIITDSYLNQEDYGGRPLTFKEAADLYRAGVRPTQQSVNQAAVAQQVEQTQTAQPQAVNAAPTANQINKEQASASVANQPPAAQAELSAEELRDQQMRTRQGDDEALAERLMHTEHIFGPNSGSGQKI